MHLLEGIAPDGVAFDPRSGELQAHPWLRVLVVVAFSCTLAVAARVPQAASGLAAAVLLLAANRPPIRALLRRGLYG